MCTICLSILEEVYLGPKFSMVHYFLSIPKAVTPELQIRARSTKFSTVQRHDRGRPEAVPVHGFRSDLSDSVLVTVPNRVPYIALIFEYTDTDNCLKKLSGIHCYTRKYDLKIANSTSNF